MDRPLINHALPTGRLAFTVAGRIFVLKPVTQLKVAAENGRQFLSRLSDVGISVNTQQWVLVVPPIRLSTVANRAFPVVAAHTWNDLPSDVTSNVYYDKKLISCCCDSRSYCVQRMV